MPELADLEARIVALAADAEALLQRGEPATRMAAVDPVLRELGWDTSNLDEVDPEYSIRSGGKVDYSLRHGGRDLVLVEAKRARASLHGHQDQLLGYAYGVGIELAVLTNGLEWWLYLPTAAVDWEQRRFLSINFREQDVALAASDLDRFLSRQGVVSGTALREAKAEFERLQRNRRVRSALPDAWRQLIAEPDGLLVELLQQKVADISGSRPGDVDEQAVVEFLRSLGLGASTSPVAPVSVSSLPIAPPVQPGGIHRAEPSRSEATPRRRRRSPVAFSLDGARYSVRNWGDLLERVCNLLIDSTGSSRFSELVAPLRTANRFSTSPRGKARRLTNGLFLDVTLSADNSERLARDVVARVRGSDDGFRIELAE